RDLRAVDGRDRRQARAPRLAVAEDRAGPAPALLAAGLRARHVELVAQYVQERGERRAEDLLLDPVDGQLHAVPSWSRARRRRTGSIFRRYSAEATASSTGWTSCRTSSGLRLCSAARARTAAPPTPLIPIRRPSPSVAAATLAIAYECAWRRRSVSAAHLPDGASSSISRTSRP